MNICNKVKRFLGYVLFRAILTPMVILCSPLVFFIDGGNCSESYEEVKSFIVYMWNGAGEIK